MALGVDGWAAAAAQAALLVFALGHCDTLDGPVVSLAQRARESGNVNLVLPWVRESDDGNRRGVRARPGGAQARRAGEGARRRHFFETLVRVHRAGEGAPYRPSPARPIRHPSPTRPAIPALKDGV